MERIAFSIGMHHQLEVLDKEDGWVVLTAVNDHTPEQLQEWFDDAKGYHLGEDMRIVEVTRKIIHQRLATGGKGQW